MSTPKLDPVTHDHAVREAIARTLAVVGLAGVALIHMLDAHDTFIETPYKGWLFVGLIVGSLATAGALAYRNDRRAWLAALLLPAGALLGFVYSRTVGLPGSPDDIGNWWEPLGLCSVFVEALVVAVAGAALTQMAAVPSSATTRRAGLERGAGSRTTTA